MQPVGDAVTAREWLRAVAELAISVAPASQQHGLAPREDMMCEPLVERLIDDVAANGSMIVGRAEIGPWSRTR